MSNELKALDNMRADVIDFRDLIESSSYSTDEDYELIKQALKRNEPMKIIVTGHKSKNFWGEFNCPKCKSPVFVNNKFCYDCGQRLYWWEENE